MGISYSDEEFMVEAPMGSRTVLLRTPERLAPHPSLLIMLSNQRRTTLNDDAYRTAGDIFLAAGHRVASFDLPNHGDRIDEHGESLTGMARAIAAGVDVFGDIRDTGQALVDHAIEKGYTRAGEVALLGVSRGGLSVMHIMAGDERVGACAVHAPITHLPALREFAHLADDPILQRSNADALVDRLADRWVLITIGETDPRIDDRSCFALHARLRANSVSRRPTLYTGPGQSHGETFQQHISYQYSGAYLLSKLAECGKITSRQV